MINKSVFVGLVSSGETGNENQPSGVIKQTLLNSVSRTVTSIHK